MLASSGHSISPRTFVAIHPYSQLAALPQSFTGDSIGMTDEGTTTSAEYMTLIDALHEEEAQLMRLISEMASFDPSQLTAQEVKAQTKRRESLKDLNPEMSERELDNSLRLNPKSLFALRYHHRLERLSAKIILLSSCVIEASINLYIALKIDEAGVHELFADIEKMDIIKKWTIVPRMFNKNYQFDKRGQRYQRLIHLIKNRNAFTHYKITMERSGKKVLTGSPHPRPGKTMQEETKILMEYCKLPIGLVKHLMDSDNSVLATLHMLYFQLHRRVSK